MIEQFCLRKFRSTDAQVLLTVEPLALFSPSSKRPPDISHWEEERQLSRENNISDYHNQKNADSKVKTFPLNATPSFLEYQQYRIPLSHWYQKHQPQNDTSSALHETSADTSSEQQTAEFKSTSTASLKYIHSFLCFIVGRIVFKTMEGLQRSCTSKQLAVENAAAKKTVAVYSILVQYQVIPSCSRTIRLYPRACSALRLTSGGHESIPIHLSRQAEQMKCYMLRPSGLGWNTYLCISVSEGKTVTVGMGNQHKHIYSPMCSNKEIYNDI